MPRPCGCVPIRVCLFLVALNTQTYILQGASVRFDAPSTAEFSQSVHLPEWGTPIHPPWHCFLLGCWRDLIQEVAKMTFGSPFPLCKSQRLAFVLWMACRMLGRDAKAYFRNKASRGARTSWWSHRGLLFSPPWKGKGGP